MSLTWHTGCGSDSCDSGRVWAPLSGHQTFPDLGDVGRVVSRLEDTRVLIWFAGGTSDLSVTDPTCLECAEGQCEWRVVDVALLASSTRLVVYARRVEPRSMVNGCLASSSS
jgi:hypothetical protein